MMHFCLGTGVRAGFACCFNQITLCTEKPLRLLTFDPMEGVKGQIQTWRISRSFGGQHFFFTLESYIARSVRQGNLGGGVFKPWPWDEPRLEFGGLGAENPHWVY